MKYSRLTAEDSSDDGQTPGAQKSCNKQPPHKARYARATNTQKTMGGHLRRGAAHRKHSSWGARERTGMSFLIVIAFFAVFGLIILTEVRLEDDGKDR